MKKIKHVLYLIIVAASFSSCLEILEDVKINNDGTGTYKLNINLSQSKNQLDKILAQDSIQGQPIPKPATITAEFNKLMGELKNQAGLSMVSYELDLTNYMAKISFNFDKIESLNLAINDIIKSKKPNAPSNPILYSFSKNTFARTLNSDLISQAASEKEKISPLLTNFEQAKMTSIIRFERNILESNHKEAKISSNFKNCFEQVTLNQILTNKSLHNHSILLQ